MKIACVVGARPNFMKIAPILEEIEKYPELDPLLVHTGQHYDYEMSQIFFEELDIPEPDVYLGVGSGSHGAQTGKIMMSFEESKKILDSKGKTGTHPNIWDGHAAQRIVATIDV